VPFELGRRKLKIPLLAYVSGFSVLIPIAIGLYKRKSLEEGLKWLWWLLLFELATSSGQLILNVHRITNLWLSHIFVLVEFSLVVCICSKWVETPNKRTLLRAVIVLFGLLWIGSRFSFEPLGAPSSYVSPIAKAGLIVISMYIIFLIAQTSEELFKDPRYWVVSGIIISSAGSLLFYAFRGIIDKFGRDELFIAYSIHWGIQIIANIIYSIGFLCTQPTHSSGGPLASAR